MHESGYEHVSDVVATFAKVFGPEKYGIFPFTAAEVVERPPKVIVPDVVIVPPTIGQVVPTDETDALEVLQVEQVTAFVD